MPTVPLDSPISVECEGVLDRLDNSFVDLIEFGDVGDFLAAGRVGWEFGKQGLDKTATGSH